MLLVGGGASVAAAAMPQIVAAHDKREETLRKLRAIADLRIGDPIPEWMGRGEFNNWGFAVSKLCKDAADLIEVSDIPSVVRDPGGRVVGVISWK